MRAFLILLSVLFSCGICAEELIREGNFALPLSQQLAPLVSFGQLLIGKNETQLCLFADAFIGKNSYLTDIIPGLLYGVTDDFVAFFRTPFSPGNKVDKQTSSGLEDLVLQLEYAYFTRKTKTIQDQATLVFNTSFPTGSSTKTPPTGFGSPTFFIGATFNHMTVHWSVFVSPGVLLTTSHHHKKFGNEFFYQVGYEQVISSSPHKIFAWMLELDGTYTQKTKFHGKTDPDSGGNILYFTPSLWYSTPKWIIQGGPGFPILQHLGGHQPTQYIAFFLNICYTLGN